jgi:hypothetical protein
MSKHRGPRTTVNPIELRAHLEEQLGFLERSAGAFDNGFDGEAKRLATTIRILVHDTSQSNSLLSQLSLLHSTDFIDTALPFLPGNVASYSGLISLARLGEKSQFIPHLDEGPRPHRAISFSDWWKSIVVVDGDGRAISRMQLILTAANQDGGTHVDPSLDSVYYDLAKKNSLNWFAGDGVNWLAIQGAERASIRQIAHEVLKTLRPGYTKTSEKPDFAIAGVFLGLASDFPAVPFGSIRRNAPCPCGSGRKFKHCHGRWP